MNLKKVTSVLLAAALVGSLAGCAGEKKEGEKSKDGKITITAVSTNNRDKMDSDPIVKTYFDSWDKFLKDHPEVEFDHEYIPHDAYQEKAQILATGDELPDMFDMKGSWMENWVNNGNIMSLDDMIKEDTEWAATLKEGASSAFKMDDSVYGLSIDGGGLTALVYYNEEIFKECGIEKFPENLDEFNDAIVKIKDKGYVPIQLGNVANWPAESCIFSYVMSRICGETWIQNLLKYDGSADFTNPDFIKALDVLKTWADLGAFNSDVNSIDYNEARVGYFDKKAAMSLDGYWAVTSILADAPQDVIDATKITTLPISKPEGDAEIYEGGGWAVAVNAKVKDDPEKMELITEWYKDYFSESNANTMYEMGKVPSIKTEGYDKSKLKPLEINYYDVFDTTPQYTVIDLHFSPSLVDVLNTSLQELLIGQVTPEEIAKRVQAEYEKSLK